MAQQPKLTPQEQSEKITAWLASAQGVLEEGLQGIHVFDAGLGQMTFATIAHGRLERILKTAQQWNVDLTDDQKSQVKDLVACLLKAYPVEEGSHHQDYEDLQFNSAIGMIKMLPYADKYGVTDLENLEEIQTDFLDMRYPVHTIEREAEYLSQLSSVLQTVQSQEARCLAAVWIGRIAREGKTNLTDTKSHYYNPDACTDAAAARRDAAFQVSRAIQKNLGHTLTGLEPLIQTMASPIHSQPKQNFGTDYTSFGT